MTPEKSIVEVNTMHIACSGFEKMEDEDEEDNKKVLSKLQRDIEVKSFVFEMNEKLKRNFVRKTEEIYFVFKIGLRIE